MNLLLTLTLKDKLLDATVQKQIIWRQEDEDKPCQDMDIYYIELAPAKRALQVLHIHAVKNQIPTADSEHENLKPGTNQGKLLAHESEHNKDVTKDSFFSITGSTELSQSENTCRIPSRAYDCSLDNYCFS